MTSASGKVLLTTLVRLSFHDCVGGCDGCMNLDHPDNNGLEYATEALETEYQANFSFIMSRADF